MRDSLQIIRAEHRSISAVLHALKQLANDAEDSAVEPRFEVFRAMLYYIDQFPERLHHPKEDQYLFALLAARAPQTRGLVEELRAEHVMGAKLIRDLEQTVVGLEVGWADGAHAFRAAVDAYATFHWNHMRKEEQELLPLAERFLTAEDWREIDAAFAGNNDPIADLREEDFARLFSRIVSLAPAPVGVGEPWKRVAPSA
jgi:hemerythrin-like domain-containing protein